MNREHEVSADIFLIKYSILNTLLDRYLEECSDEQESQLREILDFINQDLSADNQETDEYKINSYKKCLDYAKSIGKSDDDVIVMSLGIIEDEIIPVYMDIEEAKDRYKEFIEDMAQKSSRSLK